MSSSETLPKPALLRRRPRRDLVDLPFPSFPANRFLHPPDDRLATLTRHHAAQQAALASAQLQSFLLHAELQRTLTVARDVFGLTGVGIN